MKTHEAEVRGKNRQGRGSVRVRFSEYLSFAFDPGRFYGIYVFGFFVCLFFSGS